jgi:hypothetical protein
VEREEEEVLLILEGSGESIYLTRIPETLFLCSIQ